MGTGILRLLEGAANAVVQYIAGRTVKGFVGGVISSVAKDIGRKLVNEKDVTWKQVICHASAGGVIGGLAGMLGGAVTYSIVDSTVAVSCINEKLLDRLASVDWAKPSRALTDGVSGSVPESAANFAEGFCPTFDRPELKNEEENGLIIAHELVKALCKYFTTENIDRIRHLCEGPWVSKWLSSMETTKEKRYRKK